jgi:hypothetical protein
MSSRSPSAWIKLANRDFDQKTATSDAYIRLIRVHILIKYVAMIIELQQHKKLARSTSVV